MRNIAKWCCQLIEYDIEYVLRISVKGQAIANHLAEFSIDDYTPINSDFPNEGILQVSDEEESPGWKMYFDSVVNSTGSGIGAVLISPQGRHFPVTAKIDFPCTNNIAEYEGCILGLQAAIDFKVKELEVFGDSMLTIFQTLKQWKTKHPKLRTLRCVAAHFFLSGETLYRHSFDATLLQCVDGNEAQRLMEEVHEGNCRPHMNGLMLVKKIVRLGYFWSTMETNCVKHVRHCHLCQVYTNQIRAPPNELYPMAAPWPLLMWGHGPIDYFTKRIEVITLASVTAKAVALFLKRDIIAKYGVPATLFTDNAKNLNNKSSTNSVTVQDPTSQFLSVSSTNEWCGRGGE
ncbi:hypothetical protein CRG98_019904 [Punica granatum]|uniref:RNase H type-1 domain-containing protein n=1 Tax=Punica granatum TaxID=22663 RepID=A0A2I0JTV0_PUNGR|nr:hypothetical protein CRG98_019904 [Punica granatum]